MYVEACIRACTYKVLRKRDGDSELSRVLEQTNSDFGEWR